MIDETCQQHQIPSISNRRASSFSLLTPRFFRRRPSRLLWPWRNAEGQRAIPSNDSVHVRVVPHIDDVNHSVTFDILDRELAPGTIIQLGRFSDRSMPNRMSFDSKVVSRIHCKFWVDNDGK
ncbi:hypothetical protein DFQ30_002398, partial [Apophysomyces sp. BC1015]